MRALPYRTPSPDAVLATPWTSNGTRLPERLEEGWDYQTVLPAQRRVTIDVARVRAEAGLAAEDELRLCSRYWSTGSLVRHAGASSPIASEAVGGPVEIGAELSIDCGDLAGSLVVETTLAIGRATAARPFVARRPGSVLWRSTEQFAAEGGGGLLPVTRTGFTGSTLPKGAWFVSHGQGGWDQPAMGQMLVLLNEDNPGIVAALEGNLQPESADLVWEVLTLDIVHTVLSTALEDPDFAPAAAGSGDLSKAALATGFIRTWYARPGEDVAAALVRLRYDTQHEPSIVRAVLQERLHFLAKERS